MLIDFQQCIEAREPMITCFIIAPKKPTRHSKRLLATLPSFPVHCRWCCGSTTDKRHHGWTAPQQPSIRSRSRSKPRLWWPVTRVSVSASPTALAEIPCPSTRQFITAHPVIHILCYCVSVPWQWLHNTYSVLLCQWLQHMTQVPYAMILC